jgi:hypothetical protein
MGQRRSRICRFNHCDETATATVGIVALCPLHESYVLELLDRGVGPTGEPLISVGELDS